MDELEEDIVDEFLKIKEELQSKDEKYDSDLEIVEGPVEVAACTLTTSRRAVEMPQLPKADDRLTTYIHDIPGCWTEAQCNNFKLSHRWLLVKNRKLGCKVCIDAGNKQFYFDLAGNLVSAATIERGTGQSNRGWQSCQIGFSGRSVESQRSSLRKKIFEHRNSKSHMQALALEENLDQITFTEHLLMFKMQLDRADLILVFTTAYNIIKQKLPFTLFTSISTFSKHKNVFTAPLTPEKLFCSILAHVASRLRKSMVTRMLSDRSKKFSIVMYETGIMNQQATLAVHFKFHPTDGDQEGNSEDCVFFDLLPIITNDSQDVVVSLINCLQRNKIAKDYLRTNLVSFIFDEKSKMLGRATNISTTLSQQVLLFPNAKIDYDFDPKLVETTRCLYESIHTEIHFSSIFTTTVMCDSMFVSRVGPSIEYFNVAKMVNSWLTNEEVSRQLKNPKKKRLSGGNTTKISNDMALAAEAHDEQRLVIDLKSDSNSNSNQGTDDAIDDSTTTSSHPHTIVGVSINNPANNGISGASVRSRKRSWRQANTRPNSSSESETVEKDKETLDSCSCNQDKDKLFLLSLLPFMKQLSDRENLEFRMDVQQLLQKKFTSNGHPND